MQPGTRGARIRALRTTANMTQASLAEALDVSRAAVANWETDRSDLSAASLGQLARLFRVAEEWIQYGRGSGPGSAGVGVGPGSAAPLGQEVDRATALLRAVGNALEAGDFGLAAQAALSLSRKCEQIRALVEDPGIVSKN